MVFEPLTVEQVATLSQTWNEILYCPTIGHILRHILSHPHADEINRFQYGPFYSYDEIKIFMVELKMGYINPLFTFVEAQWPWHPGCYIHYGEYDNHFLFFSSHNTYYPTRYKGGNTTKYYLDQIKANTQHFETAS